MGLALASPVVIQIEGGEVVLDLRRAFSLRLGTSTRRVALGFLSGQQTRHERRHRSRRTSGNSGESLALISRHRIGVDAVLFISQHKMLRRTLELLEFFAGEVDHGEHAHRLPPASSTRPGVVLVVLRHDHLEIAVAIAHAEPRRMEEKGVPDPVCRGRSDAVHLRLRDVDRGLLSRLDVDVRHAIRPQLVDRLLVDGNRQCLAVLVQLLNRRKPPSEHRRRALLRVLQRVGSTPYSREQVAPA
mmetsp:Transcript_31573/g.101342  ORF Transcript_31573/g.101342 Transcript_31573/m.101342 type:complete len:244 (-) Transcript_31573:99-830(-)